MPVERGKRPEAEQNPDPNPWDVLGISEGPLKTAAEKQAAADKKLSELWKERKKSPEAEERYSQAFGAWVEISDRIKVSTDSGSSSESSESGNKARTEAKTESVNSFESYRNAVAKMKNKDSETVAERGKIKGLITNYGVVGALVLGAVVAAGGRFLSSGETKNPSPDSPPAVAAGPEKKSSETEEKLKKENTPFAPIPKETGEDVQNEASRKKFEKIFHKEYQRPSAERQNMPEEAAHEQVQPEVSLEQIKQREILEADILRDFNDFIPGCVVQSGGNRYFVVKLSDADGGGCFVAGPNSFTGDKKDGTKVDGFGDIKRRYKMIERPVLNRFAPFLQNARGNPKRTTAVLENINDHLAPAKKAAKEKMIEVLKEQCVEIPQDQVSQTFRRAAEMREKVEEQINQIKNRAEQSNNRRSDSREQRQRSYQNSNQRNQSYRDRSRNY